MALRKTIVGILIGCLNVHIPGALGASFYVSPKGSDLNNGSHCRPFQSLPRAQKAVRDALSSGAQDIVVELANGRYILTEPLNLTAKDSGSPDHPVTWKARGAEAVISGGIEITNWTDTGSRGIYSANVPPGTDSRNLYVNGWAANYARRRIDRSDFATTNTSMHWDDPQYDWIMEVGDLDGAEIRGVNAFTDRIAPIQEVRDREMVMVRNSWSNNIIGYDTFSNPDGFYDVEFLTWIQGALSLLDDGGQFYLDSDQGIVYYKPLDTESIDDLEVYLGVQEALVTIGGTYDEPVHDIAFENINFAHTTWLKPGQGYGYVDQQTGGYIGENVTYPEFEASRPHWQQMPAAIQISAAHDISFRGGTYTQLGSCGFGIGNDNNAYMSGLGLGAQHISVTGGYFTQVMGNSLMLGGIQANAHHPEDPRMTNSHLVVSENIFYNTSSLISSTVPIMATYVQDSEITYNDIHDVPYSGMTHGYGWGSNDVGGSPEYLDRGLYKYQPIYDTPTTLKNNLVKGNLISDYGTGHADLGAIYTLSKAPSTLVTENHAFDAEWFGKYVDEGGNSLTITNNVLLSNGNWYAPNQRQSLTTGNNTLLDNFGKVGDDRLYRPNGTGEFGNTFLRNYNVTGLKQVSVEGLRVAYRAGIPPGRRGDRPVSNPDRDDGHVALGFASELDGAVHVNLTNFDDEDFVNVSFSVSASEGYQVSVEQEPPSSVSSDSQAQVLYHLSGSGDLPPTITASVTYTNSRTGAESTRSVSGTQPGSLPYDGDLQTSSSWQPASAFGSSGDIMGIRTGGRGLFRPYDDWAAIYASQSVGESSQVSVRLLSLDAIENTTSQAGLAIRDNFAGGNATRESPYVALVVTSDKKLRFEESNTGNGRLGTLIATVDDVEMPLCLRLTVSSEEVSASFSPDCKEWTDVQGAADLGQASELDVGMVVSSGGGFRQATALFRDFSSH
ncbi:pectin lyase fold/virulence factor [Emericellopsis atlantica]|uniref:Pectin lyase fold/virulence factor n=1 Tax=Emericellopsis atlantica TaxID=2614577 RepID=A0A9P7ZGU2_9HYPO|nr:pectin lyase fold/virulence factor [Emericellopsis atlantica]KAG9251755.1 pectin lyase fold/virulence factor [Emericellopsis atlantica]